MYKPPPKSSLVILGLMVTILLAACSPHNGSTQGEAATAALPAETTTPPTRGETIQGIWHTGDYDHELTPYAPKNSMIPHLYQRTYQVYRVNHNGSCGYRSFIPILLARILEAGQWKSWLEKLHQSIYTPAQLILS